MTTPVVLLPGLELAIPTWTPDQWCHPFCYQRWSRLDSGTQMILGGHCHYNEAGKWVVPEGGVPLERKGVTV